MPELPEVETCCRGIAPHISQQLVSNIILRHSRLRWPVPDTIVEMIGQTIHTVSRRGKYLLLSADSGTAIFHLGMSGSLRIVSAETTLRKHDHIDIEFTNKTILRFHDPRRFGALLWTRSNPLQHPLLAKLGPEPLSKIFTGDYLFKLSRKRNTNIKQFIMDSQIVVGVGNIYANESLFHAGIRPTLAAGKISLARYELLVAAIKKVLTYAIKRGGTTLRDFVGGDGNPGYFSQELFVYGRAGDTCKRCKKILREIRLGQRTTVYCLGCQK